MPIAEMLAWGSVVLSVIGLALTLLVWRKIEARMRESAELPLTELQAIEGLLSFRLPAAASRAAAEPSYDRKPAVSRPAKPSSQTASAQQEFPLAAEIAAFGQALGRWCDAAGNKPMSKAMKERKLQLDGLVRRAMSERSASSTVAMQFARQTAEIVMAVVSATDKDCVDDPHREELERQLVVMVKGAGLALIDPKAGAPLNYEEHQPAGGQAAGARLGRATVKAVLSRGVERPLAAQGSGPQVLAKAEVEVNY